MNDQMKSEVEDLANEIATKHRGEIWSSDSFTPIFLGHLDHKQQLALVEHLRAGQIRSALGMIADAAYRCGIRDAPSALASGTAKIIRGRVEFMPPRIPPTIGIVLCSALAENVSRSEVLKVLKKGGEIQKWGMKKPITLPPLHKRDTDDILKFWPIKSARGGKRLN